MNLFERACLTVAVVTVCSFIVALIKSGEANRDPPWVVILGVWGFFGAFGSLTALAIEAIWVRVP